MENEIEFNNRKKPFAKMEVITVCDGKKIHKSKVEYISDDYMVCCPMCGWDARKDKGKGKFIGDIYYEIRECWICGTTHAMAMGQ